MASLLKRTFTFEESTIPITELKTKFGGQPIWLNESAWPLNPESIADEKMLFLGQIVLEEDIFPDSNGAVVYLFFADGIELLYEKSTAIVIQTTNSTYKTEFKNFYLKYVAEATGKSIYEFDEDNNAVPKEYNLLFNPLETEIPTPVAERWDRWNDFDYDTGLSFSKPDLAGNKIGGQAICMSGLSNLPAYYDSEDWNLLLQLAPIQGYWDTALKAQGGYRPNFYPFSMPMYEFTIISIFISKDYTQTKWEIQSP
jgi:uncharacterized protein YwqG